MNWITQHQNAMCDPRGPEVAIVHFLRGVEEYALQHQLTYEDTIGNDYVLGPAFAQMVHGLRDLLNGDCGRLDCGTIDRALCSILENHLGVQV